GSPVCGPVRAPAMSRRPDRAPPRHRRRSRGLFTPRRPRRYRGGMPGAEARTMGASRRQFLLSGLAATVGAACRPAAPAFGSEAQRHAVDALVHDPRLARTTRLKVLTWNIWMMPPWVRESR